MEFLEIRSFRSRGWGFAGHEFWSFVGQKGGGFAGHEFWSFVGQEGGGFAGHEFWSFVGQEGWGFAGHEFWSFVGQEVWNSIGLGSWALLAMKSGTLSAMNNPLRRADALHSFEQYRHTCEPIPRRSRMLPQNADRTVPFSDASTIAATTPASIIVEIAAMQDVHMNVIVAALRFGPLDDAFREGRQCLERL